MILALARQQKASALKAFAVIIVTVIIGIIAIIIGRGAILSLATLSLATTAK